MFRINDRVEIVGGVDDYDTEISGSKGVVHGHKDGYVLLKMWEARPRHYPFNDDGLLPVRPEVLKHCDRNPLRRWYKRFAISAWGCWCTGPCDHFNPDDPSGATGWQRIKQLIVNIIDSTIYPLYPR